MIVTFLNILKPHGTEHFCYTLRHIYGIILSSRGIKMNAGIITLIVIIVAFVLLKSIISFSLKLIGFGILAVAVCLTIWICFAPPEMHKPLSLNTIEYLFKINKDGSVTTTKQVTQTVYKEGVK